ncbi:hypothetical protein LI82_05280 [Methanococcoides methylutens]|uniref:Uncharacterized protein n=1 Tax=Methanococcoides methylutens TaxID=2226 RepID=A0A099T5H2_METMT|nr:hypothetical protein [Methanococcoides methylutens]KGK99408.1 hypothetical protein LI82_05280 [Methanococcoides methylutens]
MKNEIIPHTIQDMFKDRNGWIEFTLSKAALMITSIILLAAFYQIGADFSDIQMQRQLDSEAIALKASIDNVGSISPDSIRQNSTYSFSSGYPINAFISSEYIRFEMTHREDIIHSVKPLTFRTIPLNETEMRTFLSNNFNGQPGTFEHPLITNTNTIIEVISTVGTQEVILNTGKIVNIEKTSIYLKNDSEVNRLEVILVHQ